MGHSTPKIPIPTFNDSQKEWDSFKELFTASIINDGRLPEIVKLQNLLLHVTGPAKQALKGVTVNSTSFTVAWEKLLWRYDSNKRRLYTHFEALINLPKVTVESRAELSCLVDRVEEAVKSLTTLNCPVKHYNHWIVHLVVRKLDPQTRKDWAIHEEGQEDLSTYKTLLKFLENRINSLNDPSDTEGETYEDSTSNPPCKNNPQGHLRLRLQQKEW